MKWLIVFVLVFVLLAMLAVRYKKQIIRLIQVWKAFKYLETQPRKKEIKKENESGDIKLVACAKCGSWIPQNEALNPRPDNFYCSAKCFEKSSV